MTGRILGRVAENEPPQPAAGDHIRPLPDALKTMTAAEVMALSTERLRDAICCSVCPWRLLGICCPPAKDQP